MAPNEIWSVGPSLVMTLFDGGRREAVTQEARAKLAENGANYKSTVLLAFQQVEDNLAQLHHLGDEATQENEALTDAQRTLNLSMSRYRDGVVSYLDVVTAQTTELNTQILALNVNTRRLLASVGLIEALGGGWSVKQQAALARG
jgi:outer membrane protein TolC